MNHNHFVHFVYIAHQLDVILSCVHFKIVILFVLEWKIYFSSKQHAIRTKWNVWTFFDDYYLFSNLNSIFWGTRLNELNNKCMIVSPSKATLSPNGKDKKKKVTSNANVWSNFYLLYHYKDSRSILDSRYASPCELISVHCLHN